MKQFIRKDWIFSSFNFWVFFLLNIVSYSSFGVATSMGDALCFELLEGKFEDYGAQRVWGPNQDYKICFRKESGKGKMCYTPLALPSTLAVTDQGTFGVSGSPDAMYVKPGQDSYCSSDYLEFSGGVYPHTSAVTDSTSQAVSNTARTKLCGRLLAAIAPKFTSSDTDLKKHETVCSVSAPYEIRVRFDDVESHGLPIDPTAKQTAPAAHVGCDGKVLRNAGCESSGAPSGNIGFGLIYNQYT